MSINIKDTLSRLSTVGGVNIFSLTQCLVCYDNAIKRSPDDVEKWKMKAQKFYSVTRDELIEKFGFDDMIKYFDKEFGGSKEEIVIDDTIFINVKKVKDGGKNIIVSFDDGGVIGLINKDSSMSLIDTFQVKEFEKYFMDSVDKEKFCKYLLDNKGMGIGISSVRNVDVDEYSWYKEYILDNGLVVKTNPHGVLVDDKYLSFNEFLEEYKDKLSEDAYFEFNKYCVKQDTGERLINPFNLDVNDINIDDIITALSGINRFAGQTKSLQMMGVEDFYTVGQHTLSMYNAIKNHPQKVGLGGVSQAYRDKMAKQALLHEAFEGITGTDLISPFKYATKRNEYKIAESDAEAVMEKIFGMPLMTAELKKIDKSLAATEGHYLVGQGNVDWCGYGDIYDKELLVVGKTQCEVKKELKMIYQKEGLDKLLEDYKFHYNRNFVNDVIFSKKIERYKQELGNGLRGKDILLLAKLKEVYIKDKVILLDNGNRVAVSDGTAVVLRKNCETNIDFDDFMIEYNINDIVKLDYGKKVSSIGIEDISHGISESQNVKVSVGTGLKV